MVASLRLSQKNSRSGDMSGILYSQKLNSLLLIRSLISVVRIILFDVMIFNLFCLLVSPFMLKWLCCIQERSPLHLLFVMTTKLNPTAGKNIEKLLEKKLKTKGLLAIQH